MSRLLRDKPVYVVGIGLHRYQFPSAMPYVQLGLTAVREALADAGLAWPQVPLAVVGSAAIGMAAGRVMLRHLGSSGLEVLQVENASASGSTAFRIACLQVAAGEHDLALAVGVDKHGDGRRAATKDGLAPLSPTAHIPLAKFALLARRLMQDHGLTEQDLARVAVKNHGNAAQNPYAQFRKPRTLEQVLGSARVAGSLTALMCTPRGEGAAAVIIASEAGLARLGLDRRRAVRVMSSVACSERLPEDVADGVPPIVDMVRQSSRAALQAAGVEAGALDLLELHDAFSIEELVYAEAIGACAPGDAAGALARGDWAIGGRCAVNASGGLIGMGHPLGPTGIGQVAEIVRQLRGEAGARQHPDARLGLAHMIGLGSVAVAHVLAKEGP
jgi:acetyl-CoA acetyltransferase